MIFGFLSFALMAVVLYFAVIGVRTTVLRIQGTHGLIFIRDLIKYVILFVAVLITCLGLSGLLGLLLDTQNIDYYSKLDAARWLAFIVVGIPVTILMSIWIRRDFNKNLQTSQAPAWQIYLLVATTVSFLIWFAPMERALQWIIGKDYLPRELAQVIVALVVWAFHLFLLRGHKSVIANGHRFAGMASGIVAASIALIRLVDYAISANIDVATGEYQLREALLLLGISVPVALLYWFIFEYSATDLEARIYRTFAGMVIPSVFFAVGATLALKDFLVWNFGTHIEDSTRFFTHTPQWLGFILVLGLLVWYFRHLVRRFSRDDLTRLYQYLMSAAALVGLGLAGGWLIAGLFEFNNFPNTFITGVSGLTITLPLWWVQWRKCQEAIEMDFDVEDSSPIRRIYLYVTIGAPTLAAIGASVWLFYVVFKAMLVGGFDITNIQAPVGMLASAGVIALYQLRVYQDHNHRTARRTAVTLPKMAH